MGCARFVHSGVRLVSECILVGVQFVVAAALRLRGPGRVGTGAVCCVPATPFPLVGPLWVWGILWPAGVLVGLVPRGLLAAGVVMMPILLAPQVM